MAASCVFRSALGVVSDVDCSWARNACRVAAHLSGLAVARYPQFGGVSSTLIGDHPRGGSHGGSNETAQENSVDGPTDAEGKAPAGEAKEPKGGGSRQAHLGG